MDQLVHFVLADTVAQEQCHVLPVVIVVFFDVVFPFELPQIHGDRNLVASRWYVLEFVDIHTILVIHYLDVVVCLCDGSAIELILPHSPIRGHVLCYHHAVYDWFPLPRFLSVVRHQHNRPSVH